MNCFTGFAKTITCLLCILNLCTAILMNKSLQILLIDKSKAYSKTDVSRNSANIQILEVNY